MRDETVLVVGATSSLAQSTCRELAKKGCSLLLAGRDEHELELLTGDLAARYRASCKWIVADLLEQHFSADRFVAEVGAFEHLIIAVGDMGNGDATDSANLFYVNYINYVIPAQIATAAAHYLSEKQHGTITIISSVSGDRGRQSNIAYGSAKAALSSFASGLRNKYTSRGVHVMTVKPGFTDTPMTWGMNTKLMASREYVAEKIVAAMEKKKDVLYVPFFWRYIMLVIQHIPERIFKKMKL